MAEFGIASRDVNFDGSEEILLNISSKTVAIVVLASLPILSILNLHAKSLWSAAVGICRNVVHGAAETETGSGERTKEDEDGVDVQCVICLCDVSEGDVYRLLPQCKHGFHVSCIDAWLQTHSSCPLCRCPVPCASAKKSTDQERYLMDIILSHLHRFLDHLCTWFVNPLGFDQQLTSNTFSEDYRAVL